MASNRSDPSSLKRAPLVPFHDAQIVRAKPPQGKYSDAQRIAYTSVILMGAGSLFSGLAIYKTDTGRLVDRPLRVTRMGAVVHFWLTILLMMFFLVHVIQVALAGRRNFRSMIRGYDANSATNHWGSAAHYLGSAAHN